MATPEGVWAWQKARKGARGAAIWGSSDTSRERGCWHAPAMLSPAAPRLLQKLSVACGTESCDIASRCKSSAGLTLLVCACRGLAPCLRLHTSLQRANTDEYHTCSDVQAEGHGHIPHSRAAVQQKAGITMMLLQNMWGMSCLACTSLIMVYTSSVVLLL